MPGRDRVDMSFVRLSPVSYGVFGLDIARGNVPVMSDSFDWAGCGGTSRAESASPARAAVSGRGYAVI